MAQQMKGYRSDSGKIFDAEHDAWLDDLDHWLGKTIDNRGMRTLIWDAITTDAMNGNHLRTIIANIERTAPPKVADDVQDIAA